MDVHECDPTQCKPPNLKIPSWLRHCKRRTNENRFSDIGYTFWPKLVFRTQVLLENNVHVTDFFVTWTVLITWLIIGHVNGFWSRDRVLVTWAVLDHVTYLETSPRLVRICMTPLSSLLRMSEIAQICTTYSHSAYETIRTMKIHGLSIVLQQLSSLGLLKYFYSNVCKLSIDRPTIYGTQHNGHGFLKTSTTMKDR